MRDEDGTQFVPIDGSVAPLRTDSVLAELLRAANADVRVDFGVHSRVRGLLPSSDQAWLTEGGAHLVSPLMGSTGVLLGIVALGEAADAVTYEERDRAAVASMCAQVAVRLENVWLRENQGSASGERHLAESARAVDWQNEPAEVCPRCSRVWPPVSTTCECGARLTSAALPLLLKGQFQVERLLGSGGMGVVYLATDMALGRKVALKTLPKLSNRLAARLQQEARAMATVLHPHLALIYGADQWRGTPVLIVEYLEGGTLLDWLRRGPLTVEETLSLGIVLADVLDRLHRTGTLPTAT